MADYRIDVMTLFPDSMRGVLGESIIGRAAKKGIIEINCVQIRDFTENKQMQVDDYPYGGGWGLVMMAQPLKSCLDHIKAQAGERRTRVIYMSPQGKPFNQEEAKRLLETGEERTVNRAVQAVNISRSAFYKYKDAVRPFNDMLHGRIVTFQTMLRDEPGILSGLLNVFAGTGVNILTINQNIPTNGCAVVTITAETSALRRTLEEMLEAAASSPGVLRCEILAG